jgi:hypothetical protein
LILATELRTRAEEILVRAANTDDLEIKETMRVVTADYQNLSRLTEQRLREAGKT